MTALGGKTFAFSAVGAELSPKGFPCPEQSSAALAGHEQAENHGDEHHNPFWETRCPRRLPVQSSNCISMKYQIDLPTYQDESTETNRISILVMAFEFFATEYL